MGEEDALLRYYELRLLRCSLPSLSTTTTTTTTTTTVTASQPLDYRTLIEEVLNSIQSGDYVGALSSDSARTIFNSSHHLHSSAPNFYYSELVLKCVDTFVLGDSDDERDRSYRVFLVIAIAVAAFLAFTQCNITGPFETLPALPLMDLASKGGVEWEGWARNQLMSAGSDLLGKFSNLQYLVFAKMLLMRIKDMLSEGNVPSVNGNRSLSWWFARLLLLQQRLLDERSSSLFDLLQVYSHEALRHFGSLEKVTSYWGAKLEEEEALTIVSMLHLEVGLMEYAYGRVDSSRLHFESAEVASGLQLSVTGALGFRTVHQVDPKAQLVLVANPISTPNGDAAARPSVRPEIQTNASSAGEDDLLLARPETYEVSDVLMTPRFIGDDNNSNSSEQNNQKGGDATAPLKAIQQSIILAKCLSIEKSTRQDEMQMLLPKS